MLCYVTIVTSIEYLLGAAILHRCMTDVCSRYPLFIYVPEELVDNISEDDIKRLDIEDCLIRYWRQYRMPDFMRKRNSKAENTQWNNTFDKLLFFGSDSYEKMVFIDSDMMVLQNLDHLFHLPHMSAVSPSVGNSDYTRGLNSGLMVIEPETGLDQKIFSVINDESIQSLSSISDNDLIVKYYGNWGENQFQILDDTYNILFPYISNYKEKGVQLTDAKVVHFIGRRKPWMWTEDEWGTELALFNEGSLERKWLQNYQRLVTNFS